MPAPEGAAPVARLPGLRAYHGIVAHLAALQREVERLRQARAEGEARERELAARVEAQEHALEDVRGRLGILAGDWHAMAEEHRLRTARAQDHLEELERRSAHLVKAVDDLRDALALAQERCRQEAARSAAAIEVLGELAQGRDA